MCASSINKCDYCRSHIVQIETNYGRKFCSEGCFEKYKNVCSICQKEFEGPAYHPKEGYYFCSGDCHFEYTFCSKCYKHNHNHTFKNGHFYCSPDCADATENICFQCEDEFDENHDGIEYEGKFYCSKECFEENNPCCLTCGEFINELDLLLALLDEEDSDIEYCSKECYIESLPACFCCEKKQQEWYEDDKGRTYCSEECFIQTYPICMHCKDIVIEPYKLKDGRIYCSEQCASSNEKVIDMVLTVCELTGLLPNEVDLILSNNNWTLEQFSDSIDESLEAIDKGLPIANSIVQAYKTSSLFEKLSINLASYNTMRGGKKGFKGFVFEELHATDASLNGTMTEVIANNGIADFMILKSDGTRTLAQAKVGYNTATIDWSAYEGQTIIIDQGNEKLIQSAKQAGLDVVESNISKAESRSLADLMQLEGKIFGSTNAPITSKLYSMHQSGISTSSKGTGFGAGYSIGSNVVNLMTGDKEISEAVADIAKDTAKAAATSYAVGAISQTVIGTTVTGGIQTASLAFASSSVGMTLTTGVTAISVAASGTTTALGSTIIGGAIIAGTTATTSTITGSAIGAAATGVISAIAGTTIGGTVIAASPIIAAGAIIGGLFTMGRKIFKG